MATGEQSGGAVLKDGRFPAGLARGDRALAAAVDDSAATPVSVRVIDSYTSDGGTFVITLDADTYLPRDAAVRMVAAMIHPLNRPRYATGEREGIVCEGYGMLQPRVSPSLSASTSPSGAQTSAPVPSGRR